MPRRLRRHFTKLAPALALAGTACTLLARFDEPPLAPASDAGADASADVVALDARLPDSDATSALDAAADAGADPCAAHANGSYCAGDGVNLPSAAGNLVLCDGGAVAQIVACDAGCLALSNPFPDACNGCNAKPNGSYCGRDFPELPAQDADWLLQCQAGNAVQKVACTHGCTSSGPASSCVAGP